MTFRALLRPLLLSFALLATACQVEVQHGLVESEANNILVVLERSNISATKIKEEGGRELTWAISVPKGSAGRAMELLVANNLPAHREKGLNETFGEPGMIPTATEEKARLLSAHQGELARTLASIDGVLSARVHLNTPEQSDLDDKAKRPMPSASVLIKYRVAKGADGKPPVRAEQVQQLISRSVQDLTSENVAVVFDAAQLPGGDQPGEAFVDIIGLRMSADSVGTFKLLTAMSILAVLGLSLWIGLLYYQRQAPPPPTRPSRKSTASEG